MQAMADPSLTDTDLAIAADPPALSMRAVGSATAVLAVGVVIGQVFGVLRTLFVANEVGISSTFDAVLVALVLPTILGNWLSNAMRVAIVPAHAHISHRAGEPEARRFLGAVLTYLGLASILAVVLVVIFAAFAVDISGPGLPVETKRLAMLHIPVLAPMLAFVAMANLLTAVCQIGRRFLPIAVSAAVGALTAFLTTVLLWDQFGITAYALGTTADAGFSLVVLIVAARRHGLLPGFSLRADRIDVKAFAKHVLPMTVGSGVLQLNLISDRAIATLLSAGAASALKYGQQIVSAPVAALSSSWATVIYPTVVAAGAPRSTKSMGEAMTISVRYAVSIFVPLVIATVAFAPLLVDSIYGRGAFGISSVQTTIGVVVGFAPMLVLSMIQPVFTAAHNTRRRGTLLAFTGICNAILNVVLNLTFGRVLGVAGIALSSSVTLAIVLVFLAWRVPSDEGFHGSELVRAGARALAASLVPGVPIAALIWSMPLNGDAVGHVLVAVSCTMIGAVGYVVAAEQVGLPEPGIILRSLRAKLRIGSRRALRSAVRRNRR